ncbi:MAG: hypothetical protein U9Q82_01660 [Chloroflexota bacterium]|nr:hypothetical protein [Chloroflexota bacterium]
MKMRKMIKFLAMVFMAVSLLSCAGGSTTEVQEDGQYVYITVGNNNLTTEVIGKEITASYLVVGGSGQGIKHSTSFLSVIPLDAAMGLAEKYGDFRDCDSPGASAGKKNTTSMFLYTVNADIERELKSIDELAKAYNDPIIKMSLVEIKIVEHTMTLLGKEVDVNSSGLGPNYLVTGVQLIEENHSFGK